MSEIKTETISVTVPARLPGPIQVGDWVRLRLPGEEPEKNTKDIGNGVSRSAMRSLMEKKQLLVADFDQDGDALFGNRFAYASPAWLVRCEPNTRTGETSALPKPSPAEVEAALETLRRAAL
jgi:hypothetical protein